MTDLSNRKPILALDFDGVIHSYTSGWKGAAVIPDPPVSGLFEFLTEASLYFEINIWSSRSNQEGGIAAMRSWFIYHYQHLAGANLTCMEVADIVDALVRFPTDKPPAFVGIDDRVITFTGQWPSVEELRNFKPWNAKGV